MENQESKNKKFEFVSQENFVLRTEKRLLENKNQDLEQSYNELKIKFLAVILIVVGVVCGVVSSLVHFKLL